MSPRSIFIQHESHLFSRRKIGNLWSRKSGNDSIKLGTVAQGYNPTNLEAEPGG